MSADALLAASKTIRRGEWTTYGEVSVAVFGNRGAARAVGRWVAHDGRFKDAHRILRQGGQVAPGWGGGGDGPARCRQRLEAEGVRFVGERADPAGRVSWAEITRRTEARAQPRRAAPPRQRESKDER